MLCQECKKKNAVYFYNENVNGKERSLALCDECYQKLVSSGKINKIRSVFDDEDFFDDWFLSPYTFFSQPFLKAASKEKRCSSCGASLKELAERKKSFCPECYNEFKDELSSLLKSIHGSSMHKGKRPNKLLEEKSPKEEKKEFKDELKTLKKELKTAIEEERYEDAARIRDKIKQTEENKNADGE